MALTYDAPRRDLGAFLRRRDDGRSNLELLVPDVRCAGCLSKVERAVGAVPGVAMARVNLSLMEEGWPDVKFRATREHH